MKTEYLYYIVLVVYALLWACQLVTCHLTHSLIILTDSYINLYKLLDISLGILHLRTQHQVINRRDDSDEDSPIAGNQVLAGYLFNTSCTYQFKRLPLLGSFVNGLFLAALLMSAAIEGIQTCFHASHSIGHDDETILSRHPSTYPILLVGFALVELVMQYCLMKTHELREEELCSESLLDINNRKPIVFKKTKVKSNGDPIRELNVEDLSGHHELILFNQLVCDKNNNGNQPGSNRRSYDLNLANNSRESSLYEIPLAPSDEVPNNQEAKVSLKLMKISQNLDNINVELADTTCDDLEACPNVTKVDVLKQFRPKNKTNKKNLSHDNWFLVRYLASPVGLVICAAVVYFINNELVTEITDATLAVVIVILLFAASFPPMKKAGKVLLQTSPDAVDLNVLERELKTLNRHILDVRNLHVWSLTSRSNRIGTCQLVLDKNHVRNVIHVTQIVHEAKFKFLDQNIKCTTIEPMLVDPSSIKDKSDV